MRGELPGQAAVARGIALAAAAAFLLCYLAVAAFRMAYPFELEWNEGSVVHLQSEWFRLELSKAEFLELAAACKEAADILRERKGPDSSS